MQPYLARFENNWATMAILKQFLGNKRKPKASRKPTGTGSRVSAAQRRQDKENEEDDRGEGSSGSKDLDAAMDEDDDGARPSLSDEE